MEKGLRKEWNRLQRKEERSRLKQMTAKKGKLEQMKEKTEEKIPQKVRETLYTAFQKGFFLIFEKGTEWIEKTIPQETLRQEFAVNDFRMRQKANGKNLRKLDAATDKRNWITSCITAVEGAGLGVLGIGLPDIPVFLAVILKGVYETAVSYGFRYDTEQERIYILRLLCAASQSGQKKTQAMQRLRTWSKDMKEGDCDIAQEVERTSAAMAEELLVAKFVQGLPIVGVVGGLTNVATYQKIIRFAKTQYKLRYLENHISHT